jgi:hypothetical protein
VKERERECVLCYRKGKEKEEKKEEKKKKKKKKTWEIMHPESKC